MVDTISFQLYFINEFLMAISSKLFFDKIASIAFAKASAESLISMPLLSFIISLLASVAVAIVYSPERAYSNVFVGGWKL